MSSKEPKIEIKHESEASCGLVVTTDTKIMTDIEVITVHLNNYQVKLLHCALEYYRGRGACSNIEDQLIDEINTLVEGDVNREHDRT